MARFKIEAGAELDMLTKDELTATLRGWLQESVRGVKFKPFSTQLAKTGATWTFGTGTPLPGAGDIGPEPGFLWSVMRFAVTGSAIAAADTYTAYDSDVSGLKVVHANINGSRSLQKGECVLRGGERLYFAGASTGAGNDIFISGGAIEVPVQLAWMLC